MSSIAALLIGAIWLFSGVIKYLHHPASSFTMSDFFGDTASIDGIRNDGTFIGLESSGVGNGSGDYALGNDGSALDIISNDNFHFQHEVAEGRTMEIVLSLGSVLSVVGVIWAATYCEFGASPIYRRKAHIHQV